MTSDHSLPRRGFLKAAAATMVFAAHPSGDWRIRGANGRIGIGIIGCGVRGNYLWGTLRGALKTLDVEVAAVCDVWRPAREAMAAAVEKVQGARPAEFARYRDLLAAPGVDAVMIATPDFAHCPILIDAARAKKHAYCEKPLSRTFDEARAARQAVRESGIVVQVGTQRRSEGRWREAAALIRPGILGTISEIDTAWHDNGPRWQRAFDDVKPADVDWEQFLMGQSDRPFDAQRFRRWHFYRDYTNGTPGLLGSHLVDAALMLVGEAAPRSCVAHGGTYVWKDGREHADTIECLWEYPAGFLMRFSCRLGNNVATPEVRIYGTAGTFDSQSWTISPAGAVKGRKIEQQAEVPAGRNQDHTANWLECVRSGGTPNASIEHGYHHAVAAAMAGEAWTLGRKVTYDADQATLDR